MNSITAIRTAVREKSIALYVAVAALLSSLFAQPAMNRISVRAKGLSFLEYAILAAVIVGVGVLIANFFGDTLTGLKDRIAQEFGGLNK